MVFSQHRSCGSWTCPGGPLAGNRDAKSPGIVSGSNLGAPCGLDLKSHSLAICRELGGTWCLKKLLMFCNKQK